MIPGRRLEETNQQERNKALDGLRGTAVIIVMLHHLAAYPPHSALLSRTVYSLFYAGWVGVDLFFVLSGFLITGILFEAKGSQHYFRNFYMRRFLRIFPLYYGVLVVIFVLVPLAYHFSPAVQEVANHQMWLWFYGVNINIALETKWFFGAEWLELGHFWSLSVEEHFYLLWPALAFLLRRRTLMGVCGLCVAVALVLRILLIKGGADPGVVYVLTPCRMDSLAIGAFAALAVRGSGGVEVLVRAARRLAVISGTALFAMAVSYGSFTEDLPLVQTAGYPLLALLFGSVLVLSLGPGIAERFFSMPLLRFFGTYSYGLYVFHVLLRSLFVKLFGAEHMSAVLGSPLAAVLAFTVLAMGGSVMAAVLSRHLFEDHFLRWKRFFEYRQARRLFVAAGV